jgi:glycosyltransferase involved in cell wall biosynthesis
MLGDDAHEFTKEVSDQVNITVIVCSHNRCQDIAKALDSVAASRLPDSVKWEVVVVDNNSSDQTREVVEEFRERYPGRFRYLFEPQQGRAYALNAGIREARGDILVFMHDNVTVEPAWLQNLTAALYDGPWVGAIGRVILQWPSSVPDWADWSSVVGPTPHHGFPSFDLGAEAKELPWMRLWPTSSGRSIGANMAFPKVVFERYGLFRTDLGPSSSGDLSLMSEYTEFCRRLISAKKRLRYEPAAVVNHPLPEAKINKEYLLERAFEKGRADAWEFPVTRVRLVCSLAARTVHWLISSKPSERFCRKATVWEKLGTIKELRRISRDTKKKKAFRAETIRRNTEAIKRDTVHLGLTAGEWVQVRTEQEILATLDECGRLGNLPFMPEMLQHCGKQFRVHRRTDKSCDNIEPWSIRRMTNAVVLEGVRCNGEGHGGCQAGCMIFWKEAWLKRAKRDVVSAEHLLPVGKSGLCTVASILNASSRSDPRGETIYTCQATELLTYTSYMLSWDPRQYLRDLRSRNLATGLAEDSRWGRALEVVLGILRIMRSISLSVYNTIQEKRPGRPTYPFLGGSAQRTPIETLNLQPGELVRVRSREEIIATLDEQDRNRGLLFDGGMLTHCGSIYRVLRRVHRIVDEKTGKMMNMKYPCIVLEGMTCVWDYHRLCPRDTCTPYWREGWLKRAVDVDHENHSRLAYPQPVPNIGEGAGQCRSLRSA